MSERAAPDVTVLVPMRNEAAAIAGCLAAVAAQDLPLDRIEVIVVDGASSDGSDQVARRALAGLPFARAAVIANPGATTPSNLNRGLAEAAGRVLCRVDARSFVPAHYVRTCVELLDTRPDVVVVGGSQVAIAPTPDAIGVGIARALNNRFTMGLSRYRRGASSGPADTVYLGAFRTHQLRDAGGWDEQFGTNQDFELNRRMSSQGLVWFDAALSVDYLPRPTLAALWQQYQRFGRWKVAYWRTTGDPPRPRQVVALLAPAVLTFAAAAAVAARPHRARRALAVGGLGAAALLAIDQAGCRGPAGGPGARVAAVAATVVVTAGWSGGALRALARGAS